MNTEPLSNLHVERVRHPLAIRRLQVQRIDRISPHFLRLRLHGPELAGFVSASFDDHLKLMLPARPGVELVLPESGPDGPVLPPGAERPVMRDYTPRHFDSAAQTLDIECLMHQTGPATEWAARVRPGDPVGIGGPRGSFVVPLAFGCHVLIGDESAMPAIARRLEALPGGTRAIVIVETRDPADRRAWATRADLQAEWVQAGSVDGLAKAVVAMALPAGVDTFAWAAGEAATMVVVRQALIDTHGLHKSRVRASAYWKRGSAGHHEAL